MKRQSSSSLSELYILRGLSESCLSLVGSLSCLSLLYCVCYFLQLFFFSVKEEASKPLRDPSCQYQRPLLGLGCLCLVFSWNSYIHAACASAARGYPRAVVGQHVCCFSDSSRLDRFLFNQGGAVIPSYGEKCSS